jgi:beta-phosphoglucomutase
MADDLEIYFDETINNRLRGVSRMESLDIILENYKGNLIPEDKVALAEKKNSKYVEMLQRMSDKDLSKIVKDTLDELKNRGYRLAIGSSSRNAKFILERLGLQSFFHGISDGTNIKKSKPDPEVFLKAAKYLNLKPEECLVVEDALAGIDAAINGNFDSAGLGEAADYEKTTYPLKEFSELIKIL